jgi:hypothetical protein
MPIKPLDTLLAIKAINLIPGLRASDRIVGVTLIEHFNRRTGQCDPSLERLSELTGFCTRTVIRSNHALEKFGLFIKRKHGGYSNRNSYEPNWSRFAEVEAAWKLKFRRRRQGGLTDMSASGRQKSQLGTDSAVTQTCSSNLVKNKTCSERLPGEGKGAAIFADRYQPHGNSSAEAALTAAERRWSGDLHLEFARMPVTYGEVVAAIDDPLRAAASDAEMRARGSGIKLILRRLKIGNDR